LNTMSLAVFADGGTGFALTLLPALHIQRVMDVRPPFSALFTLWLSMMAAIDPHGYDAGKKMKGKKRHILVDTLGLLLHAIVHRSR
jgi:hypothetical protein